MSTGIKNDKDKAPMNLLSTEALIQISRVMGAGAEKYSAHNWRGGLAWSRVIAASLRHITSFNDGEDLDPETGISHIAHAACGLMFLLDYLKSHPELDDRYKAVEKIEVPTFTYTYDDFSDHPRKSGAV